MKLLTLNFLTCAIKACRASPAAFPLRVRDAELEAVELDFNPLFLRNMMPRLEWGALEAVAAELGLQMPTPPPTTSIPSDQDPAAASITPAQLNPIDSSAEGREEDDEHRLRALHTLLLETQIVSGRLVCGNCGHEYAVREGIANFLLPAHLV